MGSTQSPLTPWMHGVLKFAGVYNIIAGLSMMIFYHEGFKSLGLPKPEFNMPIQLVGVLVAIFGIGYLLVDRRSAGESQRSIDRIAEQNFRAAAGVLLRGHWDVAADHVSRFVCRRYHLLGAVLVDLPAIGRSEGV